MSKQEVPVIVFNFTQADEGNYGREILLMQVLKGSDFFFMLNLHETLFITV